MTAHTDTAHRLEALLHKALNPQTLHIEDESSAHAGHAGARGGGGHFRVHIVAECFEGKGLVARHRMVYDAISVELKQAVHALALTTQTPREGTTPGAK